MKKDDIIEYFQKFGDIDYLKFKNNHRSGKFRGFAF